MIDPAATETLAINILNPSSLIEAFGVIGVLLALFAETGLLVGFFLPGDSLLFTAGFLASVGKLPMVWLLIGAPIFAILGAQFGHLLGAKAGPTLFARPDSRLFRREYVEKAEHYFNKFGPARAVVLARFIPIVRTFLNPVAGVLEMPARVFLLWNVVGAVLWTEGVLVLGYYLGHTIPGIDRYLLPAIGVIIVLSVIPVGIELIRAWRRPLRSQAGEQERSPERVD